MASVSSRVTDDTSDLTLNNKIDKVIRDIQNLKNKKQNQQMFATETSEYLRMQKKPITEYS